MMPPQNLIEYTTRRNADAIGYVFHHFVQVRVKIYCDAYERCPTACGSPWSTSFWLLFVGHSTASALNTIITCMMSRSAHRVCHARHAVTKRAKSPPLATVAVALR